MNAEVRRLLDNLEKAIRFAYQGGSEDGAFVPGRGEFLPNPFLTLTELNSALRAAPTEDEKTLHRLWTEAIGRAERAEADRDTWRKHADKVALGRSSGVDSATGSPRSPQSDSSLRTLLVMMRATVAASREYPPEAGVNREVLHATITAWADRLEAAILAAN